MTLKIIGKEVHYDIGRFTFVCLLYSVMKAMVCVTVLIKLAGFPLIA